MPLIPAGVRAFAEEPEALISESRPPEYRILRPTYCLFFTSAGHGSVSRVRATPADVDLIIADVRSVLREHGCRRVVWHLGPSSRPEGLAELLRARGFVPATEHPFEPKWQAMALVEAPPPAPPGVTADLAQTYAEYVTALRIAIETFALPEDSAQAWLSNAPELWTQQDGVHRMTLLSRVEGRPVGFAFAGGGKDGVMLSGSGVLASARGRGAYRALVAARWKLAESLNTPALVIHAGAMSRPILERCGFDPVCRIETFEDAAFRG
jgi:GNAT superfamily N-acetyltransferase